MVCDYYTLIIRGSQLYSRTALCFDNMSRLSSASGGHGLLADPTAERSNCGVGVVMDLHGGRSHEVVADGLELLANLEHRGTTGAEENTGDGAGITVQTPHEFFAEEVPVDLPDAYAVGSIFLPQDDDAAAGLKALVEDVLAEHDLAVVHWRDVPTDNADLGKTAVDSEPDVVQAFVVPGDSIDDADEFDRKLYVGRRAVENAVKADEPDGGEG